MKKLTDIYSNFYAARDNTFKSQAILDVLWKSKKEYKNDILQMLDIAISEEDATKLRFCIAASFRDGLNDDYSSRFHKIILDTWHNEHEDIVDNISLLKDERFCESLLNIALNKSTYRKFDDENEPTLRKCVHALKAINTEKSHKVLAKLIETENPNVQYALDIYK